MRLSSQLATNWRGIVYFLSLEGDSVLLVCRCALEKDPARRPDAALMLHHPWVRQHVAQRRRGVFAKPEPPRSMLCAEERRRLQRGTVVDRTGMRRNTGPRGSAPASSPKRGAKSLLDKEVMLREAEEEELLLHGEGGADGVHRGDIDAHRHPGEGRSSSGSSDRDRGESRGGDRGDAPASAPPKPRVWKPAAEAREEAEADSSARAASGAPGEQGTRFDMTSQVADWGPSHWDIAKDSPSRYGLSRVGNSPQQSVF